MRTVTKAENIAKAIAKDLDDMLYDSWGDVFTEELSGLKANQRKSLDILYGSQPYKKMSPEKYLKLTRNKPLFRKVTVLGKDDNRLLAVIANRIISSVYQYAMGHIDSGDHFNSIAVFVRGVGDTSAREHRGLITATMLPDRAVISIVPIIKYASPLESILHRTGQGGIMYQAAKDAQRSYKTKLAVKYDYVAGERVGERGGTFPRLTIGLYGNVRPRMKTPKSKIY